MRKDGIPKKEDTRRTNGRKIQEGHMKGRYKKDTRKEVEGRNDT